MVEGTFTAQTARWGKRLDPELAQVRHERGGEKGGNTFGVKDALGSVREGTGVPNVVEAVEAKVPPAVGMVLKARGACDRMPLARKGVAAQGDATSRGEDLVNAY